jgi:hypothetical protein
VRGVDLHLGAHARQGAAQLVRRVRDETTLLLGRGLQPGQHRVHRPRESRDLLGSRGLRHPAVQRAAADRVHPVADALHGAQGPADDPPREPREHGRRGGDGDGQGGDERTGALLDVLQARGDADRRAVLPRGQQAGGTLVEPHGLLVAVACRRRQRSGVAGHSGQHLPVRRHDLQRDLVRDQVRRADPLPRREPVGDHPRLGGERVVEGVGQHLPLGEHEPRSREHQDGEHRRGGQQRQPGPQGSRDEPSGVHGLGTR